MPKKQPKVFQQLSLCVSGPSLWDKLELVMLADCYRIDLRKRSPRRERETKLRSVVKESDFSFLCCYEHITKYKRGGEWRRRQATTIVYANASAFTLGCIMHNKMAIYLLNAAGERARRSSAQNLFSSVKLNKNSRSNTESIFNGLVFLPTSSTLFRNLESLKWIRKNRGMGGRHWTVPAAKHKSTSSVVLS